MFTILFSVQVTACIIILDQIYCYTVVHDEAYQHCYTVRKQVYTIEAILDEINYLSHFAF